MTKLKLENIHSSTFHHKLSSELPQKAIFLHRNCIAFTLQKQCFLTTIACIFSNTHRTPTHYPLF